MDSRFAIFAGPAALVALLVGAGSSLAQDDYDLVASDAWSVDFLHAGNPNHGPSYSSIMGSGACVFDYDLDGWEDVLLVNAKYDSDVLQARDDPRSALYRNEEGTGLTKVAGALDVSAWGLGCATGDYDGDGDQDVAINTWGGVLMYRNDRGGTFTNVTAATGVHHSTCGSVLCFGHSLAWLDYDRDADLDLYVTNYVAWDGKGGALPLSYPGQCNVLWRNDGGGAFTNASQLAGGEDCGRNHLALAIADVDEDGWQDIFIASDETADTLLMNKQGHFQDEGHDAGVDDRRGGMGAAWGDVNADGRLDLAITHFEGERFALYRQNTPLKFTDRAETDGLDLTEGYVGWGVEFADLDRDADLDMVIANGHVNVSYGDAIGYAQANLVLMNDGAGVFTDATSKVWHPAARLAVSRGLALADLDQDGYLDVIAVNNANETVEVKRSVRGPNNWLALRLSGNSTVNPHALGAIVEIVADGTTQKREVVAAASYLSQSSRDLSFGVGDATMVEKITVRWPDGTRQSFSNVRPNQILTLAAGGSLVTLRGGTLVEPDEKVVHGNRVDPVVLRADIVRAPAGANGGVWTVAGETHAGTEARVSFTTLGTRTATFRVDVTQGGWDSASVKIEIENLAPEAVIDGPRSVERGTPITFRSTGSRDRDGSIVSRTWTIGGVSTQGDEVRHTFSTAGTFEVSLTLVDDEGASSTAVLNVDVDAVPPVARAGRDVRARPNVTITFDASASTDADGVIESYDWAFGDGTTASGRVVTKAYPNVGTYPVALTVRDDDGSTATDSLVATIDASYVAPIADAGPDHDATRVAPVRLDGSASRDPDGTIAAFEWEFGDGTTGTGAVVEHAYLRLGAFTANLTVTDDVGGWTRDSVTVRVTNVPPTIKAAPAIAQEGLAPVKISVDASDADGSISKVTWDFGDGGSGEGAEVVHSYSAYGRYVVRVTVTDDDGGTATIKRDLRLFARPVAAPGPDRRTDRITDLAFDGRSSHDPDGTVVAWAWDFGDGGRARGPIVAHRYRSLGTFRVTLTVTDDEGLTGAATALVTVVNLPPVARIRAYALANLDQVLAYDGRPSYDPDGDTLGFKWSLADAGSSTLAAPRVAYNSTGARQLRLVVTDVDGATASADHVVDVVDWLRVSVSMDRTIYGPLDRPRGLARVLFANGLPAEGADVNVSIVYRAHGPSALGLAPAGVFSVLVNGVADADGEFRFDVPTPFWPRAAPTSMSAQLPTAHVPGPLGESWGYNHVMTHGMWTANGGMADTRYQVRVNGPQIAQGSVTK